MNLVDVIKAPFFRDLCRDTSLMDVVAIKRSASCILKNVIEDERDIRRIIILPPLGFTSNKVNQTNCFEGVESALIEIKGAVREGKKSFSKIKNCLLVVSSDERDQVGQLDRPYLEFDLSVCNAGLKQRTYSAGQPPFFVVRPNGEGFYHTLINLSDDWLVLKLRKVMRSQKRFDLGPYLHGVQNEYANDLCKVAASIMDIGDCFFKDRPELIERVMRMPMAVVLPALGEMLYIKDTGKHETCTAFGLILKLAKKDKGAVLTYLYDAKEKKLIPPYFNNQLIMKIEKYGVQEGGDRLSQVA